MPQGGLGFRVHRAQTGGLLLEIPGENSRPVAKRPAGFDESITLEKVATAVADSGGCFVADLKVGLVARSRRRLG